MTSRPSLVLYLLRGLILGGMFFALLTACAVSHNQATSAQAASSGYPEKTNVFVAAAFAHDGSLWRVVTDKHHVYVDRSLDAGKAFSQPVMVNNEAQRIKVSIENRPGIAVDSQNRIYIIYPAEGQQPASIFFSVSMDGGKSFSLPVELSDKAKDAISLQGSIAISPTGEPYVFWHDDRDRVDYKQLGNSVYYTTIQENGRLSPNSKVADGLCECCRLEVGFDVNGEPVIFSRFIYSEGARDHGLLTLNKSGWLSQRVTNDDWRVEACPEQGPALSISENGNNHVAWFTQGNARKGLFYAHSFDQGAHFSEPMPFGNIAKLPKYPTLLSQGHHVVLAWTEFDGEKSQLIAMQSVDSGQTWNAPKTLAESKSAADRPVALLGRDKGIVIYWNTREEGFRTFSF